MIKLTTIIFLLLSAVPVLACGNGECDPEPPSTERTREYDHSKPDTTYGTYYTVCTCDEMKVAWGFESLEVRTAKARSQCEIKRTEKLECPEKWK